MARLGSVGKVEGKSKKRGHYIGGESLVCLDNLH